MRILAEDFVHLPVVERRVQTAREPLGPAARSAAGDLRDGAQRRLDA